MNKLLNSAMMPAVGTYRLRRVGQAEFVDAMKEGFISFIGYPETCAFLERISGLPVPESRVQTSVENGDRLLICRLRYRMQNPGDKSKNIPIKDGDSECQCCQEEAMKKKELIARMQREVAKAGSQKAYASVLGISEQYLCDILRGRRELGEKVLKALKVRKVVLYETD